MTVKTEKAGKKRKSGTGNGRSLAAGAQRKAAAGKAVRKASIGKSAKKPRKPRAGRSSPGAGGRSQAKKRIIGLLAVLFCFVLGGAAWMLTGHEALKEAGEVRAVWVGYVDYKDLGFYNKEKREFRDNARKFFSDAAEKKINTVYFHVRSFRDAAYLSEKFPMSRYLWDKDREIDYDPLEIIVREAHKKGIALHAWMNPYRNSDFDRKALNPASQKSIDEIVWCVEEVLTNYDVDGIHFDDYFYPEKGYEKVKEKTRKKQVNKMVRAVYSKVKSIDKDLQFGISPAGNIEYAESIGADVKTWMSEPGYIDYIVPQIYWTDRHSASWRHRMYTETLDEWLELNQNDVPMYVGLALYRAGEKASDDPGWKKSSKNLQRQLKLLREKGCEGYALFSAGDFYTKRAKKELRNFQKEVESENAEKAGNKEE